MRRVIIAFIVSIVPVAVLRVPCVHADAGGPDEFGYRWVDNQNGDTATYNWIELRGNTDATWINSWTNHDDGRSWNKLPTGNPFPFYGAWYDSFYVMTNGFITFGATSTSHLNDCLPRWSIAGPAVCLLWNDLHLDRGGIPTGTDVVGYLNMDGVAGVRVIEFDSIGNYSSSCLGSYKFEVLLFDDGLIKLQYEIVVPGGGGSCDSTYTIGIQSNGIAGSPALNYVCNQVGNQPSAGRAVTFYLDYTEDLEIVNLAPCGDQTANPARTVACRVRNIGNENSLQTSAYYVYDGVISTGMPISSLPPASFVDITFPVTIDLSPPGSMHSLDAYVENIDPYQDNDTVNCSITVVLSTDLSVDMLSPCGSQPPDPSHSVTCRITNYGPISSDSTSAYYRFDGAASAGFEIGPITPSSFLDIIFPMPIDISETGSSHGLEAFVDDVDPNQENDTAHCDVAVWSADLTLGLLSPCGSQPPDSSHSVTCRLTNEGPLVSESTSAYYRFDGVTSAGFEIGPIAPSSFLDLVFPVPIDISEQGSLHGLQAFVDNVDPYQASDTVTCEITVLSVDYVMDAPGTVSGDFVGAIDHCGPSSPDRIVWTNIPCAGRWTFSLCSSIESWDSFIYLTPGPCDGLFTWDDDGCQTYSGLSVIECFEIPDAGAYFVRIERSGASPGGPWTLDVSQCALSLTAPNGGETWIATEVNSITWTSSSVPGNVKLELNRNFPNGTWEILTASTENDSVHPWTVTAPSTDAARMKVSNVLTPSVNDVSDSNFTIVVPSIVVTSPNGGETWVAGDTTDIYWSSSSLWDSVRIELNRDYPSANWEMIVSSTDNTGSYSWIVTPPLTTHARIRVSGVAHAGISDTSDADFMIGARGIEVISPNGGESWSVGSSRSILWNSLNLSGSVNVELNRYYPVGSWESLAAGIADTGTFQWIVTYPTASTSRVRITSVDYPLISDTSDNNFAITLPNFPPQVTHDMLHDQTVSAFTITALVTDNAEGFETWAFYSVAGANGFDSLAMSATGNLHEYAVVIGPLPEGSYDYFLRARDAGDLTCATDTFTFFVADMHGTELLYDDSTAERSNWAATAGFSWAVRFTPTAFPFVLSSAGIGVSALHPDIRHTPISVQVLLADSPGGLPGTVVWSRTVGSIGNAIGGLVYPPANWTYVVIRESSGDQISLTSDFFVAVSNPDPTRRESFLQDTVSVYSGHSYIYDACDSVWYNESESAPSTRLGNRLIRVSGYELIPPNIVIRRSGNDIQLNWNSTGAPHYWIYYSASTTDSFLLMGSVTDTTFTDINAALDPRKFYSVRASMAP